MMFYLGYEGRTVTEQELVSSTVWQGLDPEFARRLLAMSKDLVSRGIPYGIGGSLRSSASQLNLFLSRHNQVSSGGCCSYQGKRYALKPGYAHAAPPGSSYHEDCTPQGRCLAADMVGDHAEAEKVMAKYGLVNFRTVNGEPWHFQPSDVPTGRRSFNPSTMWPLKPWPISSPPDDDDDRAKIVRVVDAAGNWVAPEQFVVSGGRIEFLGSVERRNALVDSGHAVLDNGQPFKLRRDLLRWFRLVGPGVPAGSVLSNGEFLQS